MLPSPATLIGYLPLAIFAGVMAWRWRTMDKARPLRLRRLWVLPAVFLVLVGFVFATLTPSPAGVGCLVLGLAVGSRAGWQRGRMMRLHVEDAGDNARVMVRQSPAALLILMGLAALRAIFRATSGAAVAPSGHAGLLITDALLGFAVGMIVSQRVVLWRRAKALIGQV